MILWQRETEEIMSRWDKSGCEKMGIVIPENRKIKFESNEINPVIKPCKAKNYLTPAGTQNDIIALDATVEPQLYKKTIFGR